MHIKPNTGRCSGPSCLETGITKEERESIINEAVERTLLAIPEVIGNLIMNHASKLRASKLFYDKYPQFKNYKELVAAVIEKIDDSDMSKNFDQIIEAAVPEIESKIKAMKNLDMKKVKKPDLEFGIGDL